MSTTIESLSLEITSNVQGAESGLTKLAASLERLKGATKGGMGLSSLVKQLNELNTAANGLNAGNISNIEGLARALQSLSGLKVSSTIGKQITSISTALSSADFTGSEAKLQGLAKALAPLSNLPKTNLSSYVSSLKKLPEAMKGLDDSTISALADKMKKLATALKPLADEMQKVANGFSAFPAKIQKLVASTNTVAPANKKAAGSFTDFYSKVKMAGTVLKRITSKIGTFITEINSYIENLNLFNASMGQYAGAASEYAEEVAEIMGIDPGEWMRNQGVFMTLATGFGVAGDRAAVMSEQLTQLGYDLSSFFNISVEDAMQKLQSGVSGELEPLRRLGYDLSQAKLEAVALSLGIDKTVSSMTQAEKAQLRYYAIMTQVTTAQGDMSRTLDAPANQLRIFKSQVTQAGRAIGSIFIPALNKILPYAIAVVKVVRILASAIANLFGFELPEIDYSGIDTVSSGAEEASEALDKASKSAKKLKSYMLGFDELNVINPDDGGGSGDDSDDESGGGGGFDFELPTYDFLGDATESRISQIVDDMKEWLGITGEINSWSDLMDTKFGKILSAVGTIGAGLLAWKLTKGFLSAITTLKTLLASPVYALTIGAILTFTGFSLEFSGIKDAIQNGLSGFNFAEIVGGALLGTAGTALLSSAIVTWIGKAFASPKIAFALARIGKNLGVSTSGAVGAALGASIAAIIAGIPMFITGIYDSIKEGISWLSATLTAAGSTLAGAGIGMIIGGPVGAGIGALIGLAVGLITDLVILIVQNWDSIVAWFKEVCAKIGKFFSDLWNGIVSIWNGVSKWFKTNVIDPVSNFFSGLWNGIKKAAKSCWDGIVDFFSPAVEWFSELFGSIDQAIADIFYNIGVIAKGCWEIIKAAWKVASNWFNEKVITPVKNFFSSLWNSVKTKAISAWDGIKSTFSKIGTWINEKVVTPVSKFFKGLWDGFTNKAKAAWEGVKSVFSAAGSFFKETFEKAWQKVVKVFSVAGDIFVDIKNGIVTAFKKVVNDLIKGINKVVAVPFEAINVALRKIRDIEILNIQPFSSIKTITIPKIPLLAEGGFPNAGQMFVAREAGPELVGTIGNRNAVVNNDQIVESVSAGVYQAVVMALGSNNDEGGDTQIIINLDGEKIYENQQKVARNRGYNLGMGAFSFG